MSSNGVHGARIEGTADSLEALPFCGQAARRRAPPQCLVPRQR